MKYTSTKYRMEAQKITFDWFQGSDLRLLFSGSTYRYSLLRRRYLLYRHSLAEADGIREGANFFHGHGAQIYRAVAKRK